MKTQPSKQELLAIIDSMVSSLKNGNKPDIDQLCDIYGTNPEHCAGCFNFDGSEPKNRYCGEMETEKLAKTGKRKYRIQYLETVKTHIDLLSQQELDAKDNWPESFETDLKILRLKPTLWNS